MSFAANLIRLMAAAGLTNAELARRLKISSQAITQWRGGRTHPVGRRLKALADALGVPTTALVDAPAGLAEHASPLVAPALDEAVRRDEEFAEITEALHAMLTEHRMPADPRTLARLARQVERDMAVYAALPFEDRLRLVLSETLSRLQRKWAEALSHR